MKKKKSSARSFLEQGCELYERREFSLAASAFHKAADLGDANAQLNLANMLDDGQGVPENHKLAIYWYKRAVRLGSSQAAYNLAISHKNNGMLRWYEYWLRIAKGMGDKDASRILYKKRDGGLRSDSVKD